MAAVAAACSVGDQGVPPGKLAVVGETVIGPEDLSGVQAQLGPYAQLRFSAQEGRVALLQALVAAELLAQEATAAGLGNDPRVELAVLEEEATVYLTAELERRVPRAEVAADTAALRAWYDAHPDEFWKPEQRNAEGVVFDDYATAEPAVAALAAGTATLESLGTIVATPLQARDDAEHPGFHPTLFEPGLSAGDWLSAPIIVARTLIVGRLQQVIPASRTPFEDPGVQEQLVQRVREPRVAAARQQLLEELAARFPEQDP